MSVLHFWSMMAGTWVLVAIATAVVCRYFWHPDSYLEDEPCHESTR